MELTSENISPDLWQCSLTGLNFRSNVQFLTSYPSNWTSSSFWFRLACSLPEYSVLWLEKKSVSKLDRFSGRNQMQGIGEVLAGTVRLA